jgi:hypothetical protein
MVKFYLWPLMLVAPLMRFGVANDNELARLNTGFSFRVRVWLWLCWIRYGLEPLIVDGLRTAAEQAALHKADKRNPATGGSHQLGKAVDMNFKRNGVIVLRKASTPAQWKDVYDLAEDCGILNGSLFNGYPDNNHFYIK